MDDSADIVGLMWYVASKTGDEPPLSCIEVSATHVAAGWAHFRSLVDSDGGISYSVFSEQVQKGFNTVFKETGLADSIKTSFKKNIPESSPVFSSQDADAEEKIDAISGTLIEKILDFIPCLSKTVFDMIDIDRSGTITEDELIAFARLLKALHDSRNSNPNQTHEMIAECLFRIFDEDNNGQIEAYEFESCFSCWIQSINELVEAVFILTEQFLFDNVISEVVSAIERNKDLPRDYAGNIFVNAILQSISANAPDYGPTTPIFENIPWIQPKIRSAYLMLSALQEQLGGMGYYKLSRVDFVNVLTPVLCDIFEIFLSLSPSTKNEISDKLNANIKSKAKIPSQLLNVLVCSPVDGLRSFLRNGGLVQVLERLFSVLDADGEGGLSSFQLSGALQLLLQEWSGPGFKHRVFAVTAFVLRLIDTNGDCLISPDELQSFVRKFVTLAFTLLNTVLQAGMMAAAATVPPLLAIALHIKAELVGGSADALRKEEVIAVLGGQAVIEPRLGVQRIAAACPVLPAPARNTLATRACPNFAHGQDALETAFLRHLLSSFDISPCFFAREHDRCYCARCYPPSLPDVLHSRGDASNSSKYIVPRGWYRFGLHVRAGLAEQQGIFETWLVSYHGLQATTLKSWFLHGAAIPGDRLVDGTVLGSTNCAGRQDRCYYTSPTIRYAGLGFYARPTEFNVDGQCMIGQVVLQCRQKPGSFERQGETMQFKTAWRQPVVCDLLDCQDEIEWFSDIRGAIIPYGLLVRVFPKGSPPDNFRSPVDYPGM